MPCGIPEHASPNSQHKTHLGMGFQGGVSTPFGAEAASAQLWPIPWEGSSVSRSFWAAEAFEEERMIYCPLFQGKFKAGGDEFWINAKILRVFRFQR